MGYPNQDMASKGPGPIRGKEADKGSGAAAQKPIQQQPKGAQPAAGKGLVHEGGRGWEGDGDAGGAQGFSEKK